MLYFVVYVWLISDIELVFPDVSMYCNFIGTKELYLTWLKNKLSYSFIQVYLTSFLFYGEADGTYDCNKRPTNIAIHAYMIFMDYFIVIVISDNISLFSCSPFLFLSCVIFLLFPCSTKCYLHDVCMCTISTISIVHCSI